jgi:hypothetical protein
VCVQGSRASEADLYSIACSARSSKPKVSKMMRRTWPSLVPGRRSWALSISCVVSGPYLFVLRAFIPFGGFTSFSGNHAVVSALRA